VVSPEAYAYDGECIAKAEELGEPGLVDIRPLPVITGCSCCVASVLTVSSMLEADRPL
jgi:hypothetical protein